MKNKKGKKLVVLGAMAALLTLIGVSGSQTYAKYVESATVESDGATVAKWGFVIDTDVTEIFFNKHQKDASYVSTEYVDALKDVSVETKLTSNVVAPGTAGRIGFTVSGKAEVAAYVDFAFSSIAQIDLRKDGTSVYRPILWTLTKNGADLLTNVDDFNTIKTTLENQSSYYTPNYDADPATPEIDSIHDTYVLSYKWPFDTSVNAHSNSEYDTILGHLANGETIPGYTADLTVDFDLAITVEQMQEQA